MQGCKRLLGARGCCDEMSQLCTCANRAAEIGTGVGAQTRTYRFLSQRAPSLLYEVWALAQEGKRGRLTPEMVLP